jgi:predicted adenine nucleotide alpha hydrolase (AANH) superfamily ATPase
VKKKLLLHICCAPCAVYVVRKLSLEYDVTCFFYNPNIHPAREYQFRKQELERAAAKEQWQVIYEDYNIKDWFRQVKGHERDPERGERCSICFRQRLAKTFAYARANGFALVASTLSISPYKVTAQINAQGEQLSEAFGIEFLPENFKKQDGFNIGKRMALAMGIKHQDYCGCVYSKLEKKQRQGDNKKIV